MANLVGGVFRGAGRLAWNYLGKPTTGMAIDALGTMTKPWVEKGTEWASKQVRQTIIPHPEAMDEVVKGINDFIAVKDKTAQVVGKLQKIIKENGLETNAQGLQERFSDLGVKEAEKLAADIKKAFEEPFPVSEEGFYIFSEERIESLKQVSATCKNYGTKTDQPVHHVFVSKLNRELNGDASPIVKKARNALGKILFPRKALNADQFRDRVRQAILDLCALIPKPPDPPLLTKENLAKIDDVIAHFGDFLDDLTLTKLPEAVVGQVREAYQIVSMIHDAQQGMIPRTFDNMAQRMKDLAIQAHETVNDIMSPDPEAGGEGTVATVLKKAKEWFDTLFVGVESAITHQAVRTIGILFEELLKFLKKHLKSTNHAKAEEMKTAMDRCMQGLHEAREHNSFGEICTAVGICLETFSAPDMEVYLQNIRMPFNPANYTSIVPNLLKLAKVHEAKKEPQKITPMMVEQKASRFKERSIFVLTMNAIEGIFGIVMDTSECTALLTPSADIPASAYPAIFRSQYFHCIDRSHTNIFVKWGAKCMYRVIHRLGSLFVHSAIDAIRQDFDGWRKKDIREKGKNVLQLGRHIFSVISGAYTSVSRTDPKFEKDVFAMLSDEVKDPARNAGLPPAQFYMALVMTALKFVRLNWIKQIGEYFDEFPRPLGAPQFLQSIFDGLNSFCKRTLQALIYIPQKILNYLLQKITGFIISRSIKLHKLIDERLGKLQDPLTSTSFAIHVVIEKKLRQITELVQARLNQPDLEVENTPGPDIQIEVVTLVKSVLQVLDQSRKYTAQDLRQYDRADRTLYEHVQREVLEQVLPRARLSLSTTLWATLQEALSEDSLLEMMYNAFTIADNAFEPQEKVTEQQFHAVDKGIADLGETLIHVILKRILDDKLDINNTKQQAEISKFTVAFKQQIQKFLQTSSALQKAIADPLTPEKTRRDNVLKINQAMHDLIYQAVESFGQAGINDYMHQGTKSQLNNLAADLDQRITPISEKIEEMQELKKEIDAQENIVNSLSGARSALCALTHALLYPNEPLNRPEEDALLLQQHITIFSKQTLYPSDELVKQYNRFKECQAQLRDTQQSILHLQLVEGQWNHYMEIKEQNDEGNEARLAAAYRQLVGLIVHLPEHLQLLQLKLLAALYDVQKCANPDLLPDLKARFIDGMQQTRLQNGTQLEKIRSKLREIKEAMELHLKDEEKSEQIMREKQALLLMKNDELREDFAALRTWEEEVGEVTIVNINFIAFMEWVQNTIHSLAVSETKNILGEVRDVMLLQFVYTCIINQALLKLLLERHGEEYIQPVR